MLVVRRSGHAKIPVYRVQHSGGADGVGGEETTKHTLPSSLIGCSAVYGKPLSVAYMRQIGNRLVIAHSTLFIHKSRSSQQACVKGRGATHGGDGGDMTPHFLGWGGGIV